MSVLNWIKPRSIFVNILSLPLLISSCLWLSSCWTILGRDRGRSFICWRWKSKCWLLKVVRSTIWIRYLQLRLWKMGRRYMICKCLWKMDSRWLFLLEPIYLNCRYRLIYLEHYSCKWMSYLLWSCPFWAGERYLRSYVWRSWRIRGQELRLSRFRVRGLWRFLLRITLISIFHFRLR